MSCLLSSCGGSSGVRRGRTWGPTSASWCTVVTITTLALRPTRNTSLHRVSEVRDGYQASESTMEHCCDDHNKIVC